MAASLNRVIIMGNLGQDPDLRYTQNQTAVCTLSVATTEFRSTPEGRQETTEWHRVVVWGKQAENASKYLSKGRTVMIEGRLQTRSWEDKQGQKRYTTEIVAQNVQFVGGATASNRQQGSSQSAPGFGGGYDAHGHDMDMSGMGGPQSSNLDDIPF